MALKWKYYSFAILTRAYDLFVSRDGHIQTQAKAHPIKRAQSNGAFRHPEIFAMHTCGMEAFTRGQEFIQSEKLIPALWR